MIEVKLTSDTVSSGELDRYDRMLLSALQADARLTGAELAEYVSLSPSPCWRRVKRLEMLGLIRGYHAELDARKLGFGVTAFVSVMLDSHRPDVGAAFEDAVRALPPVVRCHNVSGRYDFLLEVVARDLEDFGEFARSRLRALPGVKEIYSSFSLGEIKGNRELPV